VLGSNDDQGLQLGKRRHHAIESMQEAAVVPLAKPNLQTCKASMSCNGEQCPVATAKCEKWQVELMPWYQAFIYANEGWREGVSLRRRFVVNLAAFPGACAVHSGCALCGACRLIILPVELKSTAEWKRRLSE
jgi:hypothetical protein